MKFEWDPVKNEINISKHGVSFIEAETVFEDDLAFEIYDEKHSEYEDRYIIIGASTKTDKLTVCHCYSNGDGIIRIFSARRANKNEIILYERRK